LTGVVRKQGVTREGIAAVTLERDGMILVFKKVPADVCGEYVDGHTTARLLAADEKNARTGVQVDIREYIAG
jgi:hypothetical protein